MGNMETKAEGRGQRDEGQTQSHRDDLLKLNERIRFTNGILMMLRALVTDMQSLKNDLILERAGLLEQVERAGMPSDRLEQLLADIAPIPFPDVNGSSLISLPSALPERDPDDQVAHEEPFEAIA
jgi:hypothetical protein